MKAEIIVLDKRYAKKARLAERIITCAGKALGFTDAQCEVYIVDDATMEEVAKKTGHTYTGGITVLSFPAKVDFPRPDLNRVRDLGELYINPGYIEKQKEDFSRMLIHGLLHLAGYDHIKKHDTLTMENKEKELLNRIHESCLSAEGRLRRPKAGIINLTS